MNVLTSIFFFPPYYPNTKMLIIRYFYLTWLHVNKKCNRYFLDFKDENVPKPLKSEMYSFDLHLALSNVVKLIVYNYLKEKNTTQ